MAALFYVSYSVRLDMAVINKHIQRAEGCRIVAEAHEMVPNIEKGVVNVEYRCERSS